ncbi:MAG: helix-hairpin-helix domain-containing protein [Planctomycetes bacterium]|nr:helix-hairpin-helix domain-containing protein [Planctomycetota bacterium]
MRPTRSPSRRVGHADRLQDIPNVGPATAGDLRRLGITRLEQLARRDPEAMYRALCRKDGRRHDPCLRDVFAAVVYYAKIGRARTWWSFTPERKRRDAR